MKQIEEQEARRLIADYSDLILRLSYTWLRSTQDGEDICQTVLLKRLTGEETFESPEHEKAWIIRTTINACKDELRAFRRKAAPLEAAGEARAPEPPASEALEAVMTLPEKYREAIYLFYYEGYAVREIANLTGRSEAAVAAHLSRGRKKLRELLGGTSMDQNLYLSEEYRQALDGLHFSGEDKARMAEKLLAGEERKPVRRSVRPLRVGLIAACLCVALVGTALAVGQFFYLSRRHEDGITWMDGGIALYPYESLSEEIKAEAGEYHEKEFDSWQEAEEFIGIDLVNNPLLEGSPFPGKIKRHDSVSGQTTRAQTVVALSPKLSTVYTDGTFRVGNAIVWLNSMLFTDADIEQWESRKKDFGDAFTGFYDNVSEEREVTWETYTAPSGLEAQVQVCHYVAGPVEGDWSYTACFSLNGIPNVMYVYQAGIHREPGSNKTLAELYEEAGAQAREVLYQVLDDFVLE